MMQLVPVEHDPFGQQPQLVPVDHNPFDGLTLPIPDITTPKLKEGILPALSSGTLAFGQGGMPLFDEAGAAAGAGLEKMGLGRLTGGNVGGSDYGDIYDKRLQNIRNTETAFADQYPKTDLGLRIGGGVAATLPFSAEIAASPILSGATYGGSQGFAGGSGGFGNRALGSALGAALGATGGAAIKYATPSVLRFLADESGTLPKGQIQNMFGEPVTKVTGAKAINPAISGINVIKDKLELAGKTPEQYAEALIKSSPDEFAGELGGEPLRVFAQSQAKITGPNMQTARDVMRERVSEAPQRVAKIIGQIKPQENVENMLSNIQEMGAQLPKLYESSYQGTAPAKIVEDIVTRPAGQKAIAATAEKLSNQGISPLDSGIVRAADGSYRFTPEIPVRTIDEFQKSLGDLVTRNPITGAVEGSDSSVIENLRKNVTSSLAAHSKEYQKALNVAAAQKQAQAAFDMGRTLAKSASAENAESILARSDDIFSPNELSYRNAGFSQGLTDSTKNTALGTGNPVAAISKTKVAERAAEIFDDPSKAQQFADALLKEKQGMEFANRGLQNSATAETLSANPPHIPVTPHGAAATVAQKIGDLLNSSKNEQLATFLYSTTPEQKKLLAEALLNNRFYGPQVGISPLTHKLLGSTPAIPAQIMGSTFNSGRQ